MHIHTYHLVYVYIQNGYIYAYIQNGIILDIEFIKEKLTYFIKLYSIFCLGFWRGRREKFMHPFYWQLDKCNLADRK